MNFKYKCALQTAFSVLPYGEQFNFLFQKYVSKSQPSSDERFLSKVQQAKKHYDNFSKHCKAPEGTKTYYEFGAGQSLEIPMSFGLLGFDTYCVDIRSLAFPSLIAHTAHQFHKHQSKLPFTFNSSIEGDFNKKNVTELLKKQFNVRYIAPEDARKTRFADGFFDFISSSVTLEHIPECDIPAILNECHRILKPGGAMSLTIDYKDHWSYFDKSISKYNFLKYSKSNWKALNPSLHYQNRLRHKDYMAMISETKFDLIEEKIESTNEQDLAQLADIRVSTEFQGYSQQELAIKGSSLILKK